MAKIQVGQIVGRISYNCDIVFRVKSIKDGIAELWGEDMRLIADAPVEDLIIINDEERMKRKKEQKEREENCYQLFRQDRRLIREKNEYDITDGYTKKNSYFEIPGKVLHLDGDSLYLKKCTDVYDRLGVPVYGVHLPEKEMPLQISSLIEMVRPDIVVITGHDSYSKSKGSENEMKAYRNSRFFVDAVKAARKVVPYMDHLVIFAGACQSNFESILKAGANFASSPDRVNIHALDPVYVVSKVSLTPFMEKVGIWDVLKTSMTGKQGLGGVETSGALRRGMPHYEAKLD